jgi:multiple sugar transport system ATP-binding protein
MADVRFEHVYKLFGNQPVVADLCLDVADGEFLVLLGPSGCGKTTSLRMLAGLERQSYGNIAIGGRVVNALSPKARDVAMVFQSYALFPHKTVRGNLAFGMKVRGEPRPQIARSVSEVAALLSIQHLLDKRPAQLSGGERQRVALGRALLRRPQVFLMDEPLSNLDATLRVQMRAELIRLHTATKTTVIYVTHDQAEAMTMATRIAVMNRGHLAQVDTPQEIYDNPADLFVATFVGLPKMNILTGRLMGDSRCPILDLLGLEISLSPGSLRAPEAANNGSVLVGVRPEDVFCQTDDRDPNSIPATVELVEPLGSETLVSARHQSAAPLVVRCPARSPIARGDAVRLGINSQHLHLFDPTSQESLLHPNRPVTAAQMQPEAVAQ